MPIHGGVLSVNSTPLQIDGNASGWSHMHVRNNDTTKDLFIGGADVTGGNGLMIPKLETVEFDVPPGESFHVVSTGGIVQVSWLRVDMP